MMMHFKESNKPLILLIDFNSIFMIAELRLCLSVCAIYIYIYFDGCSKRNKIKHLHGHDLI